ncbi:LysR family transcriptional regulator [Agrobacterium tumefaciens str. Cherry 2E-2-2]|nr:LysR family transcriptional regulator [Agrobacterium tumefaciens str. Cherry 2E-2-2]
MTPSRLNLPLNPLRAFAIASRHKTFTAAAAELGVSQVAISRQIAILENYLDLTLFERGTRSAKLTDAGRTFGAEIAGLFDEIEAATDRIVSREIQNTVSLRVYPTFAHYWLMPRLATFTDKFPNTHIRFDTKVEPMDFRGTHLDVAIQLGSGSWREAKCRKLFDEEIDVVCGQRYFERHPAITNPADVVGHELLNARYRRRSWAFWAESMNVDISQNRSVEFDTSLLTFSAAEHGFGLAIGQLGMLDKCFEEGKLLRPINRPLPTGQAFYVVWPTTASVNVTTKRFIDWLLEQVDQSPEFFRSDRNPPVQGKPNQPKI